MSAILQMGGADLSDITATASDVLSGRKFIDKDGNVQTGTAKSYSSGYSEGYSAGMKNPSITITSVYFSNGASDKTCGPIHVVNQGSWQAGCWCESGYTAYVDSTRISNNPNSPTYFSFNIYNSSFAVVYY